MTLYDMLHSLVDYVMTWYHLVETRQIGWQTMDRRTGKMVREQQPIFKKLKLLILFNPLMDWLDRTHLMRLWIHEKTVRAGQKEGTPSSARQIKEFVDFYNINMNDFEPSDIHSFKTFEDFFVRKHAPGSRPIFAAQDPTHAVIAADCRVVVYPTVLETKKLWIKGKHFTIEDLIQDKQRAQIWADGAVASFRLSPQDYHRYHSPVSGRVSWFSQIPGDYYQVDPVALLSDVDILTRNARCCVQIDTEEFGRVLFVAIGATDVGKVEINAQCREVGNRIEKGDEIGLFQFGGSSIIVAFEKGRIEFDEDLLSLSRQQIMVDVEVGMSLGKARKG